MHDTNIHYSIGLQKLEVIHVRNAAKEQWKYEKMRITIFTRTLKRAVDNLLEWAHKMFSAMEESNKENTYKSVLFEISMSCTWDT